MTENASSPAAGRLPFSVCDSTLREGVQAREGLFPGPDSVTRYATAVLTAGLADSLEIYRPGRNLAEADFRALLAAHAASLRVYCGPASKLTEADLVALPPAVREISLTAIGDLDTIVDQVRLAERVRPELTLRLGLECGGLPGSSELSRRFAELWSHTRVRTVSLCDSSGEMTPADVTGAVATLPQPRRGQILGFHFHNDKGLAAANAYAAIAAAGSRGIRCSVDASLGGVGERNGITALEELSAFSLPRSHISDLRQTYRELHALAEAARPSGFWRLPLGPAGGRIADSHRDARGGLRPEYRGLY